jgi:beta-phosphoglucomutase-like phosphatase (HAD superfamily)
MRLFWENGIRHYFDAIVDGNDVTNAKPDPKYSWLQLNY